MTTRQQVEKAVDEGIELMAAGFDKGMDVGVRAAGLLLDNMDAVVKLMQLPLAERQKKLSIMTAGSAAMFRAHLELTREELLRDALKEAGL
ncbi:hypothetical protein PBI_ANDREW_53 [Arthrobacter phage Andrew]|uniref:Uncharacterized protein n=1 Tax=Arthrobacter phage Andrew TaxID=2419946 RepID=A0A3G2KD03_9CAUD|nr:hypothetical protein HOU53_gp53 [Arthrobacter phage Andrew]AYN56867.1 hypothetical protein PBI_ANDREW_53 [Arthrobacter phage Andrew]